MNEQEKAARAAQRDKVLSVACPACGAQPGQRCLRIPSGIPTNIIHLFREQEWEARNRG